jgi:hypothetical protein
VHIKQLRSCHHPDMSDYVVHFSGRSGTAGPARKTRFTGVGADQYSAPTSTSVSTMSRDALASAVALLRERERVGHAEPAVGAAGKATRRQDTFGDQPIDVLAGQAEQFTGLRRRDLFVAQHQREAMPASGLLHRVRSIAASGSGTSTSRPSAITTRTLVISSSPTDRRARRAVWVGVYSNAAASCRGCDARIVTENCYKLCNPWPFRSSTVPSTARSGTSLYGLGRQSYDEPRTPSVRALFGTRWYGLRG